MAPDRPRSARARNFGLDAMRALAIGLVMLSHSVFLPALLSLPDPLRLQIAYQGGYFGVELFFVLSGFLIGTILMRTFDRDRLPGIRGITRFWIRRWWRTLPNYYLFLILNVTLFAGWFGAHHWHAGYFLFLQNFAWPPDATMPESWSLAVEEWFYLTAPLAMSLACLLVSSRRRALLLALLACIVASNLARFGVAFWSDAPWDAGIRKVVALRLDAIAWGGVMAWLALWRGVWVDRHWIGMACAGALMSALAVALLAFGVARGYTPLWHGVILFTLTSAGLALLLPAITRLPRPTPWLARTVTGISLVSYSAYLVHYSLVIPLLRQLNAAGYLPLGAGLALYLPLSLLLAAGVYALYEKPMMRCRDLQLPFLRARQPLGRSDGSP